MPKAGITVEECMITKWEKQVGDQIKVGDILFSYETDKAAFECESTAEGELLEIFYEEGAEVPVLVNVCAIGKKGEDCSALRGAAPCDPDELLEMSMSLGDILRRYGLDPAVQPGCTRCGGCSLENECRDCSGRMS